MPRPFHKIPVLLSLPHGTFATAISQLQILAAISESAKLPIRKCFQFIGGCGVGGFIALCIYNDIAIEKIVEFLKELSKCYYTWWGMMVHYSCNLDYYKAKALVDQFFKDNVCEFNIQLRKFAEEHISPKVCILVLRDNKLHLFRNYPAPQVADFKNESPSAFRDGTSNFKTADMVDIAMATLAIPTVLPPHHIGPFLFQSAASEYPEPAEISLTEARLSLKNYTLAEGALITLQPQIPDLPEKNKIDTIIGNADVWCRVTNTKLFKVEPTMDIPKGTMLHQLDLALIKAAEATPLFYTDRLTRISFWKDLIQCIYTATKCNSIVDGIGDVDVNAHV